MRVGLLIFSAAALATIVGCGGQSAEFKNRDDLSELIPEAQTHVHEVLDEHFGSPLDSVAWERMPVHFHGAVGVFAENTADGSDELTKLSVALAELNRPIEPGQELVWVSGKYVGQPSPQVVSFDAKTSTVEIEPGVSVAPDAGDRFAIAPGAVLKHGRMLYAEHCQHCHGVTGDGDGPTAKYLNPKPRDYRLGKFKFTSTETPARARREDLGLIIEDGIPGTYMPSFKLLEPDESQAIVEYVRWLSMRGEIEYRLVQSLKNDYSTEAAESTIASTRKADEGLSNSAARQQVIDEMQEYLAGDWLEEFNDDTKFQSEQWRNAELPDVVVLPTVARVPDTPESRARGRKLYMGQTAKCATCHGDSGLGDGPQTVEVQKNAVDGRPGLFDDWGNPLKPRDLTRGIYRGGRRPLDLYRRVYAGIKGTPMPAFKGALKDEDIWDLVNYVTHIPFEARERRPGDGATDSGAKAPEVAASQSEQPFRDAN